MDWTLGTQTRSCLTTLYLEGNREIQDWCQNSGTAFKSLSGHTSQNTLDLRLHSLVLCPEPICRFKKLERSCLFQAVALRLWTMTLSFCVTVTSVKKEPMTLWHYLEMLWMVCSALFSLFLLYSSWTLCNFYLWKVLFKETCLLYSHFGFFATENNLPCRNVAQLSRFSYLYKV